MDKLPSNKNISKPKDDDDKCISATIASILDKICSSEINTKSSTYLPFHFIIAENQCLATDENKQILERSLPSNTSTCTATNASSICPVAAAQSSSNSCPQTTTKNINCANSRTITLQRMGKQPTPVAKILPRKSAPSNKPKLVLLHQPPSTNESGKNVNLQQQFPQASISGISSCSLISTNSAKSFSENKIKNLTTPKTFLTSIYPPSVKINTTKLVAISTPACSNSSSSHIVLPTSITPTTKNIPTTSCGSLTTTPKTVFTLKTGPISSIGGINDNNKSIKTTISSSLSSPAITTSVHPPLCLTPPRNKKSPMKRPNQLVTTTISNNGISKLYGDSKMSSINSTKFSSSSPLLDSNDLLTNTVNKVASGADISPTNQEENASLITTKTSTQTTDLTINKPKQTKKKAPIKPKILVDEQKNKGNGNTCNNKNTQNTKIQPVVSSISPQIFGASPPQAQTTLFPLESSVAETITTSTAVVFNSTGQTFPSTGMLLPNSQFALASNGNLASVSNNGMTHYLIRQPSAVGNSGGQQQFVQLMSPPIFLSPMQQIDSSGQVIQQQFDQQNQQGTSPTKFTPTNLMSARNVLFHTGNGIFMPMISNQNIVGIPQSQPFLPTTTSATNLTSISSQNPASSKFVFQLAKPTTTTNIMPNILPKISSKGKTTTATIVSTITTNTTATPEAMVIVSSSPSIQPAFINNGNFIFTNPQMQQQFQQKQLLPFLEGENVFNNNQQQFLQQLFNAQQQNIGGNLFISNNNEENKSEKKIEEGKKPTRTRKKKGEVVAGDTSTSDIELQKQQKMPHFDGMTTAIILQHGQQQGFDEEENEPPPVLCRGEITSVPPSTGTKSIENVFQKEAKIIREKMFDSNGKKYGPIVHDIDGFRIEEDVDPFPCEHQKLLEKLVIDENVVKKQQQKDGAKTTNKNGNQVTSPTEESTSNKNFSAESNTSKTKKRQRKQSSSSSEGAEERSSSFSKSPPIRKLKKMSKVEDKPKQVGRRRELENLLKMDFGPGKTPFQTSDPDEYAEEVLGGRKRTLALAAEEISARKSMDRPGSSTKKRDKEKSFSLTSTTSVTSNEKHEKNEPRRSDESIEEGRCSYCRRPFSEVGRDKEHEQYCSKDCRRMKKYEKRKQQQQKALLNEGNKASSSLNVGNEKQGNASTTPLEGNNNINSTKIRPSIQSPPSSLQNSSTPDNVKTIKPKMTSPQGSAFSTLQPQMFATNNTTILLNKKWPTTTSLDEQAAQLVQKQIGEQIASIAKGFEVQSSSSSGDEQQLPYGAPLNLIPQVTSQQMIASLPLQQQQQLFASHFLPQQAYLSGQDSNNFSFLQHSQSPPTQIPSLTPQLVMPPNNNTNTFFASQQFRQQQQNPTTSHLFLQSPTNTPTPTGNGNNEKNAEIEALVAKSIYTWTSEDVSRWVNFITNSESNGERFIQQEIDGSSLVLLTCEQLQNELKLKLGPAVKLNNALSALKARQPYL